MIAFFDSVRICQVFGRQPDGVRSPSVPVVIVPFLQQANSYYRVSTEDGNSSYFQPLPLTATLQFLHCLVLGISMNAGRAKNKTRTVHRSAVASAVAREGFHV